MSGEERKKKKKKRLQSRVLKMELDVEVNITRDIGNLTFTSTETDAVFFLLAHLPGFKKDEIEVQIDETKMEITVSGRGQMESVESVTVDRLVNISREVKIERFCEVFSLCDGIIFERVDATFDEEAGILMVLIPKLQREEASTRAENEVSCDGDKDKFIGEQPEATPLSSESIEPHDRDEILKPTEEFSSNELKDEKYTYPDPKTPVDAQDIERIDGQSDQNCKDEDGNHDSEIEDPFLGTPEAIRLPEKDTNFNPVEEQEMQESEESDDNLKDPPLEAPDEIRLPEINDASFSYIEEQEEQEPEINRSPKSKESDSNREDENPPVRNEDPEPVKLPANDRSFTLIEEQSKPGLNQNPKSEESIPNSTQEYEHATIEAEDAPPRTPASIELPEIDMDFHLVEKQETQESETTQNPKSEESSQNLKQTDQIPPVDTEEPIKMPEMDTNFNSIQEEGYREPETHQNTESKEPDQNFNREGEDSETMQAKGRRGVGKRSPGFPLNATSLLAGSAFLFSLVVLVFHFLREKRRGKN